MSSNVTSELWAEAMADYEEDREEVAAELDAAPGLFGDDAPGILH